MPSGRELLVIVIVWLLLLLTKPSFTNRAAHLDLEKLVEANRRTIGELFENAAEKMSTPELQLTGLSPSRMTDRACSKDSNRPILAQSHFGASGKSLQQMIGPEIFQDSENSEDSNAPHVRVKRISAPLNPRPSPAYLQRDTSRRMFKRFAPEESLAADENEAEYASEDVKLNVEGPGLDDETSRKRNSLEDVYPEVGTIERKSRLEDARRKRDGKEAKYEAELKAAGECGYDEVGYDDDYEQQKQSEHRFVETRIKKRDGALGYIGPIGTSAENRRTPSRSSNGLELIEQASKFHGNQRVAKREFATRRARKDGATEKSKMKKKNGKANNEREAKARAKNGKAKPKSQSKKKKKKGESKSTKRLKSGKKHHGQLRSNERVEEVGLMDRTKKEAVVGCEPKARENEAVRSIGELKDLLRKLMTKVEDLGVLVADRRGINGRNA